MEIKKTIIISCNAKIHRHFSALNFFFFLHSSYRHLDEFLTDKFEHNT
jgi:hypothetical protein